MSHTGIVVIITLITIMLKGISLLFFMGVVLSPGLCCDWLAHFGHLSNQSLSLIRIMVSPLWNSDQEPCNRLLSFLKMISLKKRWSLWSDISLFQGGPLTNQQSPVSFPKELYGRAHNATVDFQLAFLRDSLKLIQRLWLKLFQHDELSSVTWGTTNTEHFLMTILRQHREVKRCVSQQTRNVQLTPTHPISIAPSDLDTGTPPVSTVGKHFECSDTQ
eukprot:XP_011619013.1 PREDICTED: uncharacterized protein LOC105419257 [Takifugu rubripes]